MIGKGNFSDHIAEVYGFYIVRRDSVSKFPEEASINAIEEMENTSSEDLAETESFDCQFIFDLLIKAQCPGR